MLLCCYQFALFVIDLTVFIAKALYLLPVALYFSICGKERKSVDSDTILITGGGHGLGRELALIFGKLGAKVVLWDINQDLNRKTADEINKFGGHAYAYRCDVSSREDVEKVAKQVKKEVGDVTILINNAGILHCQPLLSLNHQQIERSMEVNTMAHFWTIREFLPAMIDMKRGHVVCISSMAGRTGFPNLVAYGTSKFAVAGMMKSLSEEMRHYNHHFLNFTTVHPVIINTGMAKKPRVKHPWLCPILETDVAARGIVDSVLRNERVLILPRSLFLVWKLFDFLPQNVQDEFNDFVGSGLDPHDD